MKHGCTIALLAAAAALAGCLGPTKQYGDPVVIMMDRTQGNRERWDAARQAEREMRDDPRRIDALQKLVWVRGHSADYSNYAVDQLIAQDEQAAKDFFDDAILLVADWETRRYIIDQAVERDWVDFVPGLVRSYAQTDRVYTDDARPERAAIAKLRPGTPVDQVILEVLTNSDGAEVRQRAAAWALMHRLSTDRQALIDKLLSIQSQDPLITDIQAAARDLNVLPENLETVTWVRLIRADREYWNRARDVIASLSPQQRRGVELRHVAVLVYLADVSPESLAVDRDRLLAEVRAHLSSTKLYTQGPTFDGSMRDHPQGLGVYEGRLVWADAAVLVAVTRWMADRGVVAQWFKQAEADIEDKTTEYGGLVVRNEQGRAYPKLYGPMVRQRDTKYVPPKELILDGYTALAHFHYHAQRVNNRDYAGPGTGDLRFAQRHRFNCIVITSINADELNVDYYAAPDTVIDLGTVRR